MLSQFQHLREVDSRTPNDVGGERNLKPLLLKNRFPSLRSLTLHTPKEQSGSFERFTAEFLPVERRPFLLQQLNLTHNGPFEGMDATRLIHQMLDLCDRKVLESFSLHVGSIPHSNPGPPDIVLETLAPLLALSSLRKLELSPVRATDLDNDALEEMAHAWPKLEDLDLSATEEDWVDVPRITLEGLIPLAQFCPNLESISIVFCHWLIVSEEVQSQLDQMTFCNSVKWIFCNRGPTGDRKDAEGVATFIRTLFPKLQGVEWSGDWDYEESGDGYTDDERSTESGSNSADQVGLSHLLEVGDGIGRGQTTNMKKATEAERVKKVERTMKEKRTM
ncbi:hypothetical protein NLI96_g3590 [Meripilus lineatus]|uniref:Uncharacterized protein n=1 Tax=Meripilus lineatus TaxID=2056292 RepID=A0AAD5V6J4_9APHY|nr:hypothetical protein NLI96_g3590 [Physisporinus lineatus]